jgi:hypothetical protein
MPSTRLTDCIVKLADAWLDIKDVYEGAQQDRRLQITCTYRSIEEQYRLYQVGRKHVGNYHWVVDDDPKTAVVTQLDGHKRRSKHNVEPAAALDFVVLIGGKASWDPREYEPVADAARIRGLVWGGDFAMRDYCHLELP